MEKESFKKVIHNPFSRIVLAGIVLLLLNVFYQSYLIPQGRFLNVCNYQLTELSAKALSIFGYKPIVYQDIKHDFCSIYLENRPCVNVAYPCLGLNLMGVFVVILFMFRGDLGKKVIYALLGCILMYISNVIRIATLAINFLLSPASTDFNHKYTYTILVYSLIFGLWWFWL